MSAPDEMSGSASPKASEVESELIVVAESFDKLKEHKSVKKERDKLAKKLDELFRDYEKERSKVEDEVGIASKSKVNRPSIKLIKRISSKNL